MTTGTKIVLWTIVWALVATFVVSIHYSRYRECRGHGWSILYCVGQ